MKGKHWYGDRLLVDDPEPIGATGLILKTFYKKIQIADSMFDWVNKLLGMPVQFTYFIIEYRTGTVDVGQSTGAICKSHTWKASYMFFNSEAERDMVYIELLDNG